MTRRAPARLDNAPAHARRAQNDRARAVGRETSVHALLSLCTRQQAAGRLIYVTSAGLRAQRKARARTGRTTRQSARAALHGPCARVGRSACPSTGRRRTAPAPRRAQAEKLRSKAQRPETARSTQQQCRYLLYLGRIRAIQLEYTDAKDCLQQAARKARAPARPKGYGYSQTCPRRGRAAPAAQCRHGRILFWGA